MNIHASERKAEDRPMGDQINLSGTVVGEFFDIF